MNITYPPVIQTIYFTILRMCPMHNAALYSHYEGFPVRPRRELLSPKRRDVLLILRRSYFGNRLDNKNNLRTNSDEFPAQH